MLPWQNKDEQSDFLVGRDAEVLQTGVFKPFQQTAYTDWKKTRGKNFVSDQVWEPKFEEQTEEDKQEIQKVMDDLHVDDSGEAAYIRYQDSWIHNPRYTGEPMPRPGDEELTEREKKKLDKHDVNRQKRWDERAAKHHKSVVRGEFMAGLPEEGLDEDADEDIDFDESAYDEAYKETEDAKITDWEYAVKLAEEWGKQGLSDNPDDYYSDQNDNTKPDGWTYTPTAGPTEQPTREPQEPIEQQPIEQQPIEQLTPDQEYMMEQHATDYARGRTTTDVGYLPTTETGESALFNDRALHDAMGLPEFITAARDATFDVVHTAYHPELVDAPFKNAGHITIP